MYDVRVPVDDDEERGLAQADALLDLPVDPGEMRVEVLHVFGENPEGASATQVGAVDGSSTPRPVRVRPARTRR
jgi:hypothetical protein